MGLCQANSTTQDTTIFQQPQQQSYILPAKEENSEVDPQTGSKANIQREEEDFSYVGSPNLIGFQDFVSIFEQLEIQQEQFKDDNFPANNYSLMLSSGSQKQHWEQLEWKQPKDFYQGTYQLFNKSVHTFLNKENISASGIEPDDIKQGELGDCYFLATLSAIAEYPYRIRRIFITRKVNPYGIYSVKLCHFGQWQTVVVDDYFPCNWQGPVFTKGNNNEIWVDFLKLLDICQKVLILEKAWAKLYGSYENIEAGYTREALKSLTGAPTQNIWTNSSEQDLWQIVFNIFITLNFQIQNADQEKFIMTCGTDTQGEYVGLVTGHAYTLLGCAIYQGTKLLRLRNPWGAKEWKGKWSDQDQVWTPELENQLNHNRSGNDGTFYMELCDFQKYFPVMQICYFNDNYQYTSLKIESNNKHATLIKMKVHQASDYYISVIQENERSYKAANINNYEYSNCKLLVAKVNYETKKYQWIGGKQEIDQEFWINEYLTPGDYIIYVKTYWKNQEKMPFVLSAYGANKVSFEQTQKNVFPPTLLSDIMMAHPMQKLAHYPNIDGISKYVQMNQKEGFGIFWISNNTNSQFNSKITLNKMEGLKLRKPFRGNAIEFAVKPKQQAIALVNVHPQSYILSYSEEYSF